MFKAIVLDKNEGIFQARLADLDEKALPEGDVVLAVDFSTVNYKDALALTNSSPIVRKWPMVPGIDGAGSVLESSHPMWKAGDRVILNGWGVGESHWGCLAQKARLKGDWLVRLPMGMSPKQAMAIGTAGYTAMLCALEIERLGVTKDRGEVLVTGATGGVGSVAVAILARRGYRVVASTGKMDEADVSPAPRCGGDHRSQGALGARKAAAEGALGRRRRFGRKPYARQRMRADHVRGRGGRVRARAGHGPADECRALHPAGHHASRHQQRLCAARIAGEGLGPARPRGRSGAAGHDDDRDRALRGAGTRLRRARGKDPRPDRRRREPGQGRCPRQAGGRGGDEAPEAREGAPARAGQDAHDGAGILCELGPESRGVLDAPGEPDRVVEEARGGARIFEAAVPQVVRGWRDEPLFQRGGPAPHLARQPAGTRLDFHRGRRQAHLHLCAACRRGEPLRGDT